VLIGLLFVYPFLENRYIVRYNILNRIERINAEGFFVGVGYTAGFTTLVDLNNEMNSGTGE